MRSNTVKKVKKRSVFGLFFGWTGRLAARNNSRQPKRFVITVISLTLSMTLFASFSVVIDQIQYSAMADQAMYSIGGTKDLSLAIYAVEDRSGSVFDYDILSYRDGLRTVEESDCFTNIDYSIPKVAKLYADEDKEGFYQFIISYYCEDSYNRIFNGEPPISYDDLTAQGGYILLTDPLHISTLADEFAGMDSLPLAVLKQTNLAPMEDGVPPPDDYDAITAYGSTGMYYLRRREVINDIPIVCSADAYGVYWSYWGVNEVYLAGTLGEYENGECQMYGDDTFYVNHIISCDLADEEKYEEALDFIEKSDKVYLFEDNYAEYRKIAGRFAAIRIGITFLIIMIALIAVVNMVNILSTGILNRRGELAAMQCVGMTERQLYKMTVVECLQYVLSAGVMAVILCELLMLGTQSLMDSMGLLDDTASLGGYAISDDLSGAISYLAPLPKIGLAMVPAFIAAILASMIPLRRMQKTSLVEQIQSVD